jgi:uncharacterized LabA/DUF88 family protein
MKYIIMLDGGFLKKEYADAFGHEPTAAEIVIFAEKLKNYTHLQDELIRIYYYDSQPIKLETTRPISRQRMDLSNHPSYQPNLDRMAQLKQTNFFAVREGRVVFRGWKLRSGSVGKPSASLTDSDFKPDIQQKGVDMKIGLDLAWISYNKISERILVVTGDSDFIPAFKLARRQGIQIFLFTLGHGAPIELLDHADVLEKKRIDQFPV